MLRLHSPKRENFDSRVRFSCLVGSDSGERILWFSVPAAYGDFIAADRMDPFVIGLLFEASQQGYDLKVDGKMSEAFYYHFANGYSYLLSRLTDTGQAIKLLPSELVAERAGLMTIEGAGGHVATGFSAEIDSFQTYLTHNVEPAVAGYRISRFILNNVGSHGTTRHADEVFKKRLENASCFAAEVGIELIDINSNLGTFYGVTPFQLTHTIRNVAAAMIFQGYFSKFLYSSSFKYDECFVGPSYDMGYSEPYGLHLLSTELMSCISSGSEYSRLQKTINIADFEPTTRYLDICIEPRRASGPQNCSRCWKCARALLTFEALGVLDRYKDVFDLDQFQTHRDRYIATTLRDMSRKNPNDADIVAFMQDRIVNLPSTAKVLALRSRHKLAKLRG